MESKNSVFDRDRLELIQEAARYGVIKNMDIRDDELKNIFDFILDWECSKGWQERLFINCYWIHYIIKRDNIDSEICKNELNNFLIRLKIKLDNASFTRSTSVNSDPDINSNINFNSNSNNGQILFNNSANDGDDDYSVVNINKDRNTIFKNNNHLYTEIGNMFVINGQSPIHKNELVSSTWPNIGFLITETKNLPLLNRNTLSYISNLDLPHLIYLYNSDILASYYDRLNYLKLNAGEYFKYLSKYKLSREQSSLLSLKEFIFFYENGFLHENDTNLNEIKQYNECAWNIYKMENKYVQSYCLGFDPRHGPATKDIIKIALIRLSTIGLAKYAIEVLANREKYSYSKEWNFTNFYLSFDIVSYYTKNGLKNISRNKFSEERDIPDNIKSEMKYRDMIAEEQKLPLCYPYLNLLMDIHNGNVAYPILENNSSNRNNNNSENRTNRGNEDHFFSLVSLAQSIIGVPTLDDY